ncbi:MAG: GNAT family N-acetyltransferase [Phycisphaerae bacterium]|nr:GNAT family N-acetyltransferase [Phycisphaerae bacterium]
MIPSIRPMNEGDDIELITDWFESIGSEWLLDYETKPRLRAESRQKLLQWMRGEDGNSCVLLAESREPNEAPPRVIGLAICLLQVDPNTDRKFGTIKGIYVDPAYRGHDVGQTLKEAADEWCRQAGAAFMKAYIGIGNEAMLRVCKLLGYQPWMITMVRKFD